MNKTIEAILRVSEPAFIQDPRPQCTKRACSPQVGASSEEEEVGEENDAVFDRDGELVLAGLLNVADDDTDAVLVEWLVVLWQGFRVGRAAAEPVEGPRHGRCVVQQPLVRLALAPRALRLARHLRFCE